MARPRPPEERDAFALWLASPVRNLARMREIAESVDRPVPTLYEWMDRYGWKEEEAALAENAALDATVRLRSRVHAIIDRMVQIAESAKSDRDAIQAAKVLLPYVLVPARVSSESANSGARVYVDKMLVTEVAKLPTAELVKLAAGGLEDNMIAAQTQRASKRQTVPNV